MKIKHIIPVFAILVLPVRLHTIQTGSAKTLKEFLRYTPDRLPFVSAHRGGPRKGFPENCIATFENTLAHCPAMLEIDPHYTKDSQIVLMHDPTLERTSNGQGKISGYTLAELKQLRLKDTEGNLTNYQIPTLDEALEWTKGKTILVIDAKDVPIEVRARKVIEHHAQGNAIIISYSLEDTKKCYSISRDIVMEVMTGKKEDIEMLDKSGVPWENMSAFVSHELSVDKALFTEMHKRGVLCMRGSSRNYDRQFTSGQINAGALREGYLGLISSGADIIEADLGIEAGTALQPLQKAPSGKSKFFGR